MAAPNLNALTTVTGKTAHLSATNSVADLIAAVPTGHCFHVTAVFAANSTTNGATPGWISLWHKAGGTSYPIMLQLVMPAHAAFNLLDGKVLYMEEGDSLTTQSDASASVNLNAPYEDMS